jgi:hypothetical protein
MLDQQLPALLEQRGVPLIGNTPRSGASSQIFDPMPGIASQLLSLAEHARSSLGLAPDSLRVVYAGNEQAALAEEPEKTALREVTLSLDVPQVERQDKPFDRMCEAALALASSMEGSITDDHGNAIRADTMESIHADLQKLYDTLETRDLPDGSALCRRLFS